MTGICRDWIRRSEAVLNLNTYSLTIDGAVARLNKAETALVLVLARHPGRIFSRGEILDLAGFSLEVDYRAVDAQVKRTRRKLEAQGIRGVISTDHALGYHWSGNIRIIERE